MNLPKSLRFGPFKYTVEAIPEKDRDEVPYWGLYQEHRARILMHPDREEDCVAETLLHEIFHGLFDMAHLDKAKTIRDYEEVIVDQLSVSMAQFMRDNPKVVKDLIEVFSKS